MPLPTVENFGFLHCGSRADDSRTAPRIGVRGAIWRKGQGKRRGSFETKPPRFGAVAGGFRANPYSSVRLLHDLTMEGEIKPLALDSF
jgi:hypothetical protein